MRQRRLILHIGTQKTGSTSLQKLLDERREPLLTEGVLYASTRKGFKHKHLARAARQADLSVRDALMSEFDASGAHTLIVSDEAFWRASAEAPIAFFAPLREQLRIEVVVYLRRPDLYIESLYKQTLRTGRDDEQRDIAAFWRSDEIRGRLDYAALLQAWSGVADALHVFDFAREVKSRGLVRSFFEGLSLGVAEVPADRVDHRSPDGQWALAMRQARALGLDLPGGLLERASLLAEQQPGFVPTRQLLGRRERQALLAHCGPELERLQARHGVAFSASLPPDEPEDMPGAADPAYLLRLLQVVCERLPDRALPPKRALD